MGHFHIGIQVWMAILHRFVFVCHYGAVLVICWHTEMLIYLFRHQSVGPKQKLKAESRWGASMEAEDPLQSTLCEELDMDVWALREGDNQEEYFSFSF